MATFCLGTCFKKKPCNFLKFLLASRWPRKTAHLSFVRRKTAIMQIRVNVDDFTLALPELPLKPSVRLVCIGTTRGSFARTKTRPNVGQLNGRRRMTQSRSPNVIERLVRCLSASVPRTETLGRFRNQKTILKS